MLRHRFPIGDTKPHYDSLNCPCKPTLYEGDGEDLCFHHAFDGREAVIAVEILLNMRCEDCGHYIDKEGRECAPPPQYIETIKKDPPS